MFRSEDCCYMFSECNEASKWNIYGENKVEIKESVWLDMVVELKVQYCRDIF